MAILSGREHRLMDLSKVRDNRYKGAGIHVTEGNWGRCTAMLCEWVIHTNALYGGTSPFPYGIYFFEGDLGELDTPPEALAEGPFLEVVPCDRQDRRAVKFTWNEGGTEAGFGFAPLAAALGIDPPKGTTLWLDAIPGKDKMGRPVMLIPVGDKIQSQAVEHVAAAKQNDTGNQG